MTATGHSASSATDNATEPNNAVLKPLRPREPITTRSASRLARTIAAAGDPSSTAPVTSAVVHRLHSATAQIDGSPDLGVWAVCVPDADETKLGPMQGRLGAGPVDGGVGRTRAVDGDDDPFHRSAGRAPNDDNRARTTASRGTSDRTEEQVSRRTGLGRADDQEVSVRGLDEQRIARVDVGGG